MYVFQTSFTFRSLTVLLSAATAVLLSLTGNSPFQGTQDQNLAVAYISVFILVFTVSSFDIAYRKMGSHCLLMARSLFSLVELTEYWHGTSQALMKNQKLYKPGLRHAVGAFSTFSCASTLVRSMVLRHQLTKTELYVLTKKKPSLMNILFHHPKGQDPYMMMVRRWLIRMRLRVYNIHFSTPKTEVHQAPAHKLHLHVTDVW